MQFQDDLAAGVVLVRPALQSPDYVTGVSGWAIKIDGSAEFNDVVIRGGTTVGGTGLYYNGTPTAGNLMLSISAASGVDAFGNDYAAGLGLYDPDGSSVVVESGAGAGMLLTPQDTVGVVWNAALVNTTIGASSRGGLNIASPSTVAHPQQASFTMFGGGPTTSDTSILFAANRFNFNGLVQAASGLDVTGAATVSTSLTVGGEFSTPSIQWGQFGISSGGVAVASATQVITFATPYPAGITPTVVTNINNGAGTFGRWGSRAISITNTGFTLFVFKGDSTDANQILSNFLTQWVSYGHS